MQDYAIYYYTAEVFFVKHKQKLPFYGQRLYHNIFS